MRGFPALMRWIGKVARPKPAAHPPPFFGASRPVVSGSERPGGSRRGIGGLSGRARAREIRDDAARPQPSASPTSSTSTGRRAGDNRGSLAPQLPPPHAAPRTAEQWNPDREASQENLVVTSE